MGKERKPAVAPLIVAVVVILLPIAYVLSIGPALWLGNHCGYPTASQINTFYRPVLWATTKTGASLVRHYMDWWSPD